MARITLEELYRGEGGGAKYGAGGIMGAVMKDILSHGIPSDYDRQTWIELLLIKHTLLAAKQMATEGDCVSDLSESQPPSCCQTVR